MRGREDGSGSASQTRSRPRHGGHRHGHGVPLSHRPRTVATSAQARQPRQPGIRQVAQVRTLAVFKGEGGSRELSRQDLDLSRLRPGVHLDRRRAGVLRLARTAERTEPLPGRSRRASRGRRWRRWWWRRIRRRSARDVQRGLQQLRQGSARSVPAARRQAGVLLRLLRAEATAEERVLARGLNRSLAPSPHSPRSRYRRESARAA